MLKGGFIFRLHITTSSVESQCLKITVIRLCHIWKIVILFTESFESWILVPNFWWAYRCHLKNLRELTSLIIWPWWPMGSYPTKFSEYIVWNDSHIIVNLLPTVCILWSLLVWVHCFYQDAPFTLHTNWLSSCVFCLSGYRYTTGRWDSDKGRRDTSGCYRYCKSQLCYP